MSKIFAYIPSAYKVGKTYTAIPNDGNGDFTFSRPAAADRTDENGDTESMATNVPRIDYSDDGCPVLLLDNSLSERAYNATPLTINPNQMVWELELAATSNTAGTDRKVAMSNAGTANVSIGYPSLPDNRIFINLYNNGVTIADITFDYSDNTILRNIKVVKNGTDILVKIDNVYVGGVFDATDLPTMEEISYSSRNISSWMDGKTRNNTVDDDVTTFDSTATSWGQVVNNISNLFTER